jgi:hypothetical protein
MVDASTVSDAIESADATESSDVTESSSAAIIFDLLVLPPQLARLRVIMQAMNKNIIFFIVNVT